MTVLDLFGRVFLASSVATVVLSLWQTPVAAQDTGDESRFRAQFEKWYVENPPSPAEPSAADRALLERHKPIYFLGPAARLPADFYAGYIARGTLYAADGSTIARSPNRAKLNKHARDPGVRFVHDGPGEPAAPPVVYGRVDRDTMPFPDGPKPLVFLQYTLVFEVSGLPMGLSAMQDFAANLGGDPTDWHQLDHYVNVTVVLDTSPSPKPPKAIAAIFQHHNYLRTWRLGGAPGPGRLDWPPDGRMRVDIALRSNEAYPHSGQPTRWRSVSFMEGAAARYLVTGLDPPLQSAEDITDPSRPLYDLPLVTLPPADAFYTFRGALGAARLLPGRSGPPGADYNTLAAFKRPAVQLAISYWYDGLTTYPGEITAASAAAWRDEAVDIAPFLARFHKDWAGK